MADNIGTLKYLIEADKEGANKSENDITGYFNGLVKKLAGLGIAKKIGEAVFNFGKQSLDAMAEFEQLEGGVETLYTKLDENGKVLSSSAEAVMNNSRKAYLSAGMSVNEYAQLAISASGALERSLKGDTEAMAKYTDMMAVDMADNVNKLGTSMEAVQNAYSGFAKGNFSMLDNLALGYGGTKSEMEKLLKDAEKLQEANGKMVDYSIDSYADIVEAIHVVQTEKHISGLTSEEASEMVAQGLMTEEEAYEAMGTTAKEALTTVSGSYNAMTKAWESYMAGQLGIGDVIDTVMIYLENMVNMLMEQVIPNIMEGVSGVVDWIIQKFRDTDWNAMGETLLNAINELVNAMVEWVFSIDWVQVGYDLHNMIVEGVKSLASFSLKVFGNIFNTVVKKISQIDWKKTGQDLLKKIGEGISNLASWLWQTVTSLFETAKQNARNINWRQLGSDVMTFIINAISNIGSTLWSTFINIFNTAKQKITTINWGQVGRDVLNGIKNGILGMGNVLKDVLVGMAQGAWQSVKSFLGINSPSRLMRDTIGKMIPLGIAVGIEQETPAVDEAMEDVEKSINVNRNVFDKLTSDVKYNMPNVDVLTSDIDGINLFNGSGSNKDIFSLLQSYLPDIAEQKEIVLDTGKTIGALSKGINRRLGLMYNGEI